MKHRVFQAARYSNTSCVAVPFKLFLDWVPRVKYSCVAHEDLTLGTQSKQCKHWHCQYAIRRFSDVSAIRIGSSGQTGATSGPNCYLPHCSLQIRLWARGHGQRHPFCMATGDKVGNQMIYYGFGSRRTGQLTFHHYATLPRVSHRVWASKAGGLEDASPQIVSQRDAPRCQFEARPNFLSYFPSASMGLCKFPQC